MEKELSNKLANLLANLAQYKKVVIAYSGGVDSSFLALAAKKIELPTVCLLLNTPLLPEKELAGARTVAKEIGVDLLELASNEFAVSNFVKNDPERCYHCKKYRLELIDEWASANGYQCILEGSNADDIFDYRPGMKALAEYPQVKSPLKESGLTKADIRLLSKEWGLSTCSKASFPCLATRIQYNEQLTQEKIARVLQAENHVIAYCPPNANIRVRVHNDLARIEVDKECLEVLAQESTANLLQQQIKNLGFNFVTLDLTPFKSGSMNVNLEK